MKNNLKEFYLRTLVCNVYNYIDVAICNSIKYNSIQKSNVYIAQGMLEGMATYEIDNEIEYSKYFNSLSNKLHRITLHITNVDEYVKILQGIRKQLDELLAEMFRRAYEM